MRTRRTVLRVALLLPLGVGLLAVPGWAQEAEDPCAGDEGRTVEVMVGDAAYAPAEVTIEPCDTVLWTFIADEGQSVTAAAQGESRPFDSHPDCRERLGFRVACSDQGETFPHRFTTEGSFAYASRVDDELVGRVVVALPPPPSPSPTPTPTPSPTPSSPEPTPSETATSEEPSEDPDDEDEPDDGEDPEDEGDAEPPLPTADPTSTEASPQPSPTASPVPQTGTAPRFTQAPVDPGPDEIEGPLVAGSRTESSPSPTPTASRTSDEPEFDDLPSAAELDDDEPDEVVIAAGDDGGGDGGRLVWGLFGGGLLAATLGTFGRIVLFGDAWG